MTKYLCEQEEWIKYLGGKNKCMSVWKNLFVSIENSGNVISRDETVLSAL